MDIDVARRRLSNLKPGDEIAWVRSNRRPNTSRFNLEDDVYSTLMDRWVPIHGLCKVVMVSETVLTWSHNDGVQFTIDLYDDRAHPVHQLPIAPPVVAYDPPCPASKTT
jgi:hypothetical protein